MWDFYFCSTNFVHPFWDGRKRLSIKPNSNMSRVCICSLFVDYFCKRWPYWWILESWFCAVISCSVHSDRYRKRSTRCKVYFIIPEICDCSSSFYSVCYDSCCSAIIFNGLNIYGNFRTIYITIIFKLLQGRKPRGTITALTELFFIDLETIVIKGVE